MNSGPLDGLRILDLSRILAGPFATQLLGDMGADVIKVERANVGDDTRSWEPPFLQDKAGKSTPESAYFLSANRNKRSVAVDFCNPSDAVMLRELAATCDVVVENFRPGGLKKYSLDHESLMSADPRLVYCSISGYGQTGPNASKPGYDLLAQAYAGVMAITGEPDGEPMKVGVGLAALRYRDGTGKGQHIDISLVDSTISWLVNNSVSYLTDGSQKRYGNQHPNIVPYQVFQVRDGHVIVAAGNDAQFARFCTLIGREEITSNPDFATNSARLANRDALVTTLQVDLMGWTKANLIPGMEMSSVPGGPINTLADVFESDQVAARNMKISMAHPTSGTGTVNLIGNPIKFSESPITYRRAPPRCGEHTSEIIDELKSERA